MKIILPNYRPRVCEECPLCGKVPADELESPGTKWTRRCMMDWRLMSGRGCKSPTARNRCGLRQYRKAYYTCRGEFELSAACVRRYGIEQQRILFPP